MAAAPPALLLLCMLLTLSSGAEPGSSGTPTDAADAPTASSSTALAVTGSGRALHHSNQTVSPGLRDDGSGSGPRRRQQWDMVGPALMLGGTLALLVLAAVGHLASKALLASMLSAALSAVQLSRQPGPNRQG